MRSIYLLVIISTIIIFCNPGCKQDSNYIGYHQQTIKANLLLINKQFDSAQIVLDNTFEQYSKHFYKDIHNACLCAIQLKNYEKAHKYAKELVLHGYEISDYKKYYFVDFRNSEKWDEFKREYPKLRKKYLHNQDAKLRNVYYKLSLLDQNIAQNYGVCNRNELYHVYYSNAQKLLDLYHKNGLPNFLNNKDTLNIKYWAFFRHYFGMKNIVNNSDELKSSYPNMNFDSLNWQEILLHELHKGNVSPEFYSQVVSYHDPNKPFGKCAIRLDFRKELVELFTPMSKEKAELVNKNRYEIGLMPYVEANSDILKTTWYAHYPFKEIKQAFLECDTCETDSDYFELLARIENQAIFKYSGKDICNGFLFDNYNGLKEKWLENINEYEINLKKNDSCSKSK